VHAVRSKASDANKKVEVGNCSSIVKRSTLR
jgi:hypothetical protein